MNDARRTLPSVDALLRDVPSLEQVGPTVAAWLCRRAIDAARERIEAGADAGDVRTAVTNAVATLQARGLRAVINATGIPLHTNLGRAPLSEAAIAAVVEAARATPIEFDLATGRRADRAPVAATLAAALCGAEDALIVNNTAGALLLTLAALAKDREVIVSRGELVEIGGGFRLPEVMEAAGVRLREVGTTNKTRLSDYDKALGADTGMILSVHPSNFTIVGFTEKPFAAEIAALARAHDVPYLFDIGSGLLTPTEGPLGDEPDATSVLAAGADLVCFSGDKLLGGPQAGVIAGRAHLIEQIRRHPIARAVRADKLSLAALEATLWARARSESVPIDHMISPVPEQIRARCEALAQRIPGATVAETTTVVGGESAPGALLQATVVCVPTNDPNKTARMLRSATPPIVARVERDQLMIDLRTVDPIHDDHLVAALA